MTEKKTRSGQADDLRRRAEEMAFTGVQPRKTPSPEEAVRLLHELQVHQIELEMQNEELRRAQAELEASHSRYFDLYDLAPVGYFTLSEKGLILEANLTGAALLGVRRTALAKLPWTRLVLPDDQDIYYRHRKQLFESGAPQTCELRMLRVDAAPFWARLVATLAKDADGTLVCRVVMSDISDRKQAEEALLQSKAELQQYAAALESSNRALGEFNHLTEAATRAKSEFLANMSHEIRTPMTAILGYTDLMMQENVGRATQEHVKVIHRNGKHLMGLINDILDLSKVEAGKMEIESTRCSPCEIVAEVALLMRIRADAKHLKLVTQLVSPLPETVLTDPLRLRQVLVNLVGNAIKFTDQGEVRITVRLTDSAGQPRLRFDVSDTGIGMNEEQIGNLFKAFSQVDNSSTRKFGGTGLGLCISKRLTEAMDGNIEVRSEPGRGSTFSVTINPGPLDGIRMIRNAQESQLDHPSTATTAPLDKIHLHGRVLLVEDGPDNQRLIALLLRKAGANVIAVENGQMAVEAAWGAYEAGKPFDMILMDMQMPVLDGYEATRQLRARGYTGPIVALTAHAMAADSQRCLAAGCNAYLPKPCQYRALLEMVAPYITAEEGSPPTPAGAPPAVVGVSNA